MKKWILLAEIFADRLEKITKIIITMCFSIMVLAILVGVFTRNINFPITWLEELSRYLQIWFVSLGFAVALRKGMLFGTEIILKNLTPKIAAVVVFLNKILMMLTCIFFLYFSNQLIHHLISTGQRSANLRIPIVWIYIGIYLGFVLAFIFLLVSLLLNLVGEKDGIDRTFETLGGTEEIDDNLSLISGGN